MKIIRIEVENFRSIKKYDFELKGSTFFVGQNNHGKTNLFEAISWFDSGKTQSENYHLNDKNQLIKVRVHYIDVQKGVGEIVNEEYKKTIQNVIGDADEIVVEKTSIDDKRAIIVNGVNKGNPRGFDSALNYFLPKIEYVTTKTKLADVSGYKAKSPIAEMLSGVLVQVVEQDPKYKEFSKLFDELFNSHGSIFRNAVTEIESGVEMYLQKQFAEGATVDFKINDPKIDDMLKGFETEVDDGIKTKAENKGDGMQRALMLAIIQAYADYRKKNGIARNFVFLIDEAELHLHPSAQRALKTALKDIVENGGQVLINTHSSIFINENSEDQLIYSVSKKDGVSNLLLIKNQQEVLNSIYLMLGGSPNDLLLPRNFVIVEGQSEYNFLTRIISRFYQEAHNIKILFARGDSIKSAQVYHRIAECFTPLHTNGVYKETVCILLDLPNDEQSANFELFKRMHPWVLLGEQLHILPVGTLEEYYPLPWKRGLGEIRDEEKVSLAIEVAENISKEQFESDMATIHTFLVKAIEKSYG